MRAVVLDVPQELIEERRRKGLDLFDEVWDGVLHMVPPASSPHQRLAAELIAALLPLAKSRDLVLLPEAGLFDPDAGERNYRVPDLVVARPEFVSHRGVEGNAELVIEILSPGDETYDKLPFYEALAVTEFLILHPTTCTVELFVRRGDRLHAALPGASGSVAVASLGVSLATVAGPASPALKGRSGPASPALKGRSGPALRLSWPEGSLDL